MFNLFLFFDHNAKNWTSMLKKILTSIYYLFRIKNWNTLPFNPKLNLTLIGKIACRSLRVDSHDFVLMNANRRSISFFFRTEKRHKLLVKSKWKLELICALAYTFLSQLHSNHSWLKCMLFMNVSEGQLLSWMILDKWGSKCWQFNELQVSEHLFRGLTLSHRAFYMASALPQWLTAPWPITTFTLLIHTRPHHNFSLCRWTLGTISHWKGLGKGQLPFCMAIKQYSMCQSFLLSHIPRDFLDTI